MKPISFKRHRFHPDIIRQAVWLYFGFTMSLRDVEDLIAKRGIDVTCKSVRCWVDKFGPVLNGRRPTVRLRRSERGKRTNYWTIVILVKIPALGQDAHVVWVARFGRR